MPTTERIRARGRRNASRVRQRLAEELRDARLAAGVSQRHVAGAAGSSQSHVSRVELAQAAGTLLDELACHCAALGLRLDLRTFPVGSPVRDAGQLRLIERLRAGVSAEFGWATEVLVGPPGDYRAWDVHLTGPGTVGIDAETRLSDIQALQRRIESKARASGVDRVVLLVAGTHHNRRVLRDHRETLRSTVPADTAEVMAALRAGRLPARSGIVVL
jgi:transcriptional regulator with XRE-family HTH domain